MQSEQIDKLVAALAKAQGQIKNPIKNKKVTVTTKAGGHYEFEYADLAAIIDAIKPLSDNGIARSQWLEMDESGKYRLVTMLMCENQFIGSSFPILGADASSPQSLGSAITHIRRYALTALVGIAADTDDDANAVEGNQAEFQARKPRAPESSKIKPPPGKPPVNQLASKPVELPPPQGSKWVDWGRNFLDIMSSTEDRYEWIVINSKRIVAMASEAPKVFQRMITALETMGVDTDVINDILKQHEDTNDGRAQDNIAPP